MAIPTNEKKRYDVFQNCSFLPGHIGVSLLASSRTGTDPFWNGELHSHTRLDFLCTFASNVVVVYGEQWLFYTHLYTPWSPAKEGAHCHALPELYGDTYSRGIPLVPGLCGVQEIPMLHTGYWFFPVLEQIFPCPRLVYFRTATYKSSYSHSLNT